MAGSAREAVQAAHHPAVLVTPASPYSFDHEDFRSLVWEVTSETGLMADAIDIRLGYLYGDAWPPDWTWVNFILDEAAAAAVGGVITAIGAWGRRWIRRARERDPDAKPIKAVIYGPDGQLLREVEVPPDDD